MFIAFLDANVLVPAALTDTVLRVAEAGVFQPRWSDRVLQEVRLAVMGLHPDLPPARIDARLRSMNRSFPEACVDAWQGLENELELPDQNDRHVLAAAWLARADVIASLASPLAMQTPLAPVRWRLTL
ncbi:MAG: PIN domain-containing protein [Bifidobacteriaceae bacterium]|nr:PIN domain-containing protein [Bifidobacteriaceae bacterium]